jgi:hypothetical protein
MTSRATEVVAATDLARHRRKVKAAGGWVVMSAPCAGGYVVTVEWGAGA